MMNAANWTTRLHELASRAGVPGATLGIWSDGQEILAAHGVLNRATGVAVTDDSLFQVGSITKIWTTTMIMQLVDEGSLSLSTTVAEALPDVHVCVADIGGQVTIQHLLTHTSGIDGDIFTDTGRGDDCVERYVSELAGAASAFPAGTAYSYCNSGFVLLGRIIEVSDGQSWDKSLRARLTGPLALTKTVTLPEEAILHRAAVGHRVPAGNHDGSTPVKAWSLPRSLGPAALITSDASDLLTFARLHLDGGTTAAGRRLLSRDGVSAMQQRRAWVPEFAVPGAAIGLGWRLGSWGGRKIFGHNGDTVGQSAYLRIDPESGVAACLLTNAAESEPLFRELFDEVFGDLAGVTMPAPPGPAAAFSDRVVPKLAVPNLAPGPGLDPVQYAGRYERASRRFDVSVRDGQLRMMLTVTGTLADLVGSGPEELTLYPADSSGQRFVLRSHEGEPWIPVSFGQLEDRSPYLYLGDRVTPRVG